MKDAKENPWKMTMGIVICMAVAFPVNVHIYSVLTLPKHTAVCASNMAIKKICSENGCTYNAVRKGVCINHQSWCKALLHCDWLWKGIVSDRKVQTSLQMLVGGIYNWYAPCWSARHYHGHHGFNSLAAMGAHERQLFDKLLCWLVTSTIFVHC